MAELLERLIVSGHITDLALAILAIEFVVVVLFMPIRRRVRIQAACNVISGVALIAALRCALTDAPPMAVALFLALGFVAHCADVGLRLRAPVRQER